MPVIAPAEQTALSPAYISANRARMQGKDTVHIALDYRRMLRETHCGLLSHRRIRAISREMGMLLERDWQIPADQIDYRQLSGEIRLHVVGYFFLRSEKCAVIDLNVLENGRVEDPRGWINFLSRTVFQVL